MNDNYLKQVLARRAERDIPASVDVTNAVFGQLKAEIPPPTFTAKRPPRLNLRWAALLVIVLLISGTTVYALVQRLIQPDRGISTMQIEQQMVAINQTNTLDLPANSVIKVLSITVNEAYADSNRISVGYTVNGTAENGAEIKLYSNPTLTDSSGRSYLWLVGSSQQNEVVSTDAAGEHFTHEGIMSFDAATTGIAPNALDLRLKIDVAFTTADLRANEPMGMMMAGLTEFAFSLPVTVGREVTLGQTAASGSQSITAERVVITPSMMRLEICLSDAVMFAVDAWLSWETPATLAVNGQPVFSRIPAYFSGSSGQPLSPDAACRAVVLPEALANHTGHWELTLDGFRNTESGQVVGGTWSFTFGVK